MEQDPSGQGMSGDGLAPSRSPNPLERIYLALGLSPRAFRPPVRPIDWILPVAIVLVILLAGILVIQDLHMAKAAEQMRAQIQSNPRFSDEQRSEALDRLDQGKNKGIVMVSLLAGSVGGVLIGMLLASALLLAIINFGLGGSARFANLWFIVSLSWVPKGIESLLFTGLARARSSLEISFGPAALVSADGVLKRILQVFDVFDIWMIGIQIVGVGVLAGIGSRKSTTAVISLWVLWWLVAIAIAVVTRGLPGAS
jgi:hypothetical protein